VFNHITSKFNKLCDMTKKVFLCIFVLASLLIITANIIWFQVNPGRNPNANQSPSAQSIIKELNSIKKPTSNYMFFSKKITNVFFYGIKHYWPYSNDHNLGLSYKKNWSLWALLSMSQFMPNFNHEIFAFKTLLTHFEYLNYKDALYRGVGLCSQHAMAVYDYMTTTMNFPSKIITMNGHVVEETVFPNKKTYTLDADFNVVLPFDTAYAQKNPSLVYPFYKKVVSAKEAKIIARIYSNPHDFYFRSMPFLWYGTCILNWLIPITILFLSIRKLIKMKNKALK